MSLLGVKGKPFQYLDQWVPSVDLPTLHNEVSEGIAKAHWLKTPVSAGVHPDWKYLEMATYYFENDSLLTPHQQEILARLVTREQKIKFLSCITPQVHPFWVILLRSNTPKEQTLIANKSNADDCFWTEESKHFPTLLAFINDLPLASVGRVIIFMTEPNNSTVPHFDGIDFQMRHINDDFIYFRTAPDSKKIFVMDGDTKEKFYPDPSKKFIWFNEKDYHGTDSCPTFSFSIRVEGKFRNDVAFE